jgi:hypothetical protein
MKFKKSFIQKHKPPPHHVSTKKKKSKITQKIILKSYARRVDSSLLQIPQLYFEQINITMKIKEKEVLAKPAY